MVLQSQHVFSFDHVAFFRRIHKGKSLNRYRKGTVIYAQGDRCDAVYFLQSGRVRLTVCSPRGKEAIIGLMGPGDFLGEGSLVGQSTRVATATAVIDSTAICVEKAVMTRMLRTEQEVSEIFLSYLLKRTLSMEADLLDQMFNSTDKRLARALVLLARVGKGGGATGAIPRVTHETLAQMIGATRAQVSTFMSQFRKKGFIHYDGDLHVNKSLVDFMFRE